MEGMNARVERVVSVRIFGSLDQLLRFVNVLRRSRAEMRSMEVRLFGREILVMMKVEGRLSDLEWVVRKIYNLPEVRSAELLESGEVIEPVSG
ncbi:MAG: hypothetical protein QXJ48_03700 [Candidatus Korarchaeum sp.]